MTMLLLFTFAACLSNVFAFSIQLSQLVTESVTKSTSFAQRNKVFTINSVLPSVISTATDISAKEDPSSSDGASSAAHYDAAVIGGGPAGLLSAIMLAQLPPYIINAFSANEQPSTHTKRIIVYDRLPPPPSPDNIAYSTDISKYYLIGLSHRGQSALRHFHVWDEVSNASVPVLGRRDWPPGKYREEDGVVRLADNKAVTTRVLARDKLVGVLKRVIETRYSDVVELKYGYQVDVVSFGNEDTSVERKKRDSFKGNDNPVKLQISQCIPINDDSEECSVDQDSLTPTIISTNFLIGADGAARTIANAIEYKDLKRQNMRSSITQLLFGKAKFQVRRFLDDNQRVYKSIPLLFPSHWAHNLNYSARSTNNRAALEALPSDAAGNYCGLLLLRPDDELARQDCNPDLLRDFFDTEYPQFSKLIGKEVMDAVAKKKACSLPGFRFAGPRLHEGSRTVILGDCIHTVKPYYGLGANTALEDVSILSTILNSTSNLANAVKQFSKQRAADSRALVMISRGMDRPGKIGTMRFVLPLILDSTFHKLAPKFFGPSMFGMFQLEGMSFRQIQLKKRKDRISQTLVISSGLFFVGMGVRSLVNILLKLTGF